MGTHPLAPSTLDDGASLQSVAGELPYLLKLMAAAQPLSLQTHPDRHRAEAGFELEEQRGVARDSPERVYRDPVCQAGDAVRADVVRHVVRLSPVDDTVSLLHEIDAHDLAVFLQHEKLATTVAALYHRSFDTTSTIAACRRSDRVEADWSPSSTPCTPAIRRSSSPCCSTV